MESDTGSRVLLASGEEGEEIAALNLAKFRTAQGNLGESHERADLNEQAVAKLKAKGKAGSVGPSF